MSEQNNLIELRSEKVRNIIGQIPSRIIRAGISVIFIVVFLILIGAYLFRFNRTIDMPARLYSENNKIHYTIEISKSQMKYIQAKQKITINIHDQLTFNTTLQEIDTTLQVNKYHAYYNVKGVIFDSKQHVNGIVKSKARIYTGKTNVIDFVLNK